MFRSRTLLTATLTMAFSVNGLAVVATKLQQETLNTYATIAKLNYKDALKDAKTLQAAIHAFAADPSAKTLQAAKDAWLASRESYGTTEIFRLSNGPIDAEAGWVEKAYGNLEPQINSWPLDENMIDYTMDADYRRTSGNIIDSSGAFTPGGEDPEPVDVSRITVKVLADLNENGGEANVSSGYHPIEFLLWGQDQDYHNILDDKITHGAMIAGQRPLSDFTSDALAKRRLDYLVAASDKLVADLALVTSAWAENVDGDKGLYRAALLGRLGGADADKNIAHAEALKQIFAGIGMFSKSELANERIAVAVLTPSEEDEHSCFSDNTHRDLDRNYQGIKNVLLGQYRGKKIGPSFYEQLPEKERSKIDNLIRDIEQRIARVNDLARTKMHFDYQIHPENEASVQNIVTLKNQLRRLGDQMVTLARVYGISLTADEVTDPEENHDYEL